MEDLRLRKATPADSEFAYQTKKAAFREYVEAVWGWEEEEQRRLHERRFAAQEFRVIEVAGVAVGILAVVRQPDCLKVNQVFLLPAYQGRGIGAACMAQVIEDADAAGLPVRLQVLRANPRAVAFYERLGFAIAGETETHVLMERAAEQAGESR